MSVPPEAPHSPGPDVRAPAEEAHAPSAGPRRLQLGPGDVALAAAFATLVVAVAQIASFHGLRNDDAFISYRYAQNLVHRGELAFNPGDPLLGTTAPGHVLVAALLLVVLGDAALPTAMAVLGCLAWSAQGILWFSLLRSRVGLRSAAAASLATVVGFVPAAQFVPLETHLVMALDLAALLWADRGRDTAASAAVGVACVVRPDALALALPLMGWILVRGREARSRSLAAFGAAVLPWLLFATWRFGSPVPHTASAKQGSVSLERYAEHVLRLPELLSPIALPSFANVFLWALIGAGTFVLVRRDTLFRVVAVWTAGHLAAYCALRPMVEQHWHLYPALAACGVALICASHAAYGRLRASLHRLVDVMLIGTLLVGVDRFVMMASSHEQAYWLGARDQTYRAVAVHLKKFGGRGDVVSGEEVGTIAFHTDLAMNDLNGLVTRTPVTEIGPEHPNHRWFLVPRPCRFAPNPGVPGRQFCSGLEEEPFCACLFDAHAPIIVTLPPGAAPP